MSDITLTPPEEIVLTIVIFIGMGCCGWLCWVIWGVLTGLYDHVTGHWKRISHTKLNAHRITPRFSVGGDAK